jgi:hypothetical protein
MTNEVTKYKDLSTEELMALTGQSTGKKSDFPRLEITKGGFDEQKRPWPPGYAVTHGGQSLYGEPAFFRPFINTYSYGKYNPDTKKFDNRTIMIKGFNEDALDELGGLACGRINKKQREGLSEEVLKEQKNIKCYRTVYGLVSMNGRTIDGEKHELKDLPVYMRLSGDNFMPIQEPLDWLARKKMPMLSAVLELTTSSQRNGSNTWCRLEAEVVEGQTVKLGETDWQLLKEFQQSIDRYNQGVLKKREAFKNKVDVPASEAEVINAIEAEFHDDTKFLDEIGHNE